MDDKDAMDELRPSAGGAVPAEPIGPRMTVDADQTASDADQTASDADQTASDADQSASDADQSASDADQATADRDQVGDVSQRAREAYEASGAKREQVSLERHGTAIDRERTARERGPTAQGRDAVAGKRDDRARERDARARSLERSIASFDAPAAKLFEGLREQAAADRAEAARDRARAARDRAQAARERARLEKALLTAHLDDLTGAYRREMGRLALSNEIDRARRGGGRFVLAFVDVDGLKGINDRDGHAAGDGALRNVVKTIGENLRSFDPIIRYGGDEFVAGMGGMELQEAERRFDAIQASLKGHAGIGISVGLVSLANGETADELTARADQVLYSRKRGSR
ncbi:MAG: diguanylate cyclase [Chloroflexi bacterium]|nr:diguanylate cyclase [Chloroflexota bacterium]